MPNMKRTDGDGFRAMAEAGDTPDCVVLAATNGKAALAEDGSRKVRFVFSDATVDRCGDVISPDGWDLAEFKSNAVALWSHDSSILPIGRAHDVHVKDGKLVGDIEFASADLSRLGDAVYRMVKAGFLNAVSVGFVPTEWKWIESGKSITGIHFLRQKLLEISVCSLPANPAALIEGRAAGIDIEPMIEWAEDMVKHDAARVLRLAEGLIAAGDKDAKLLAWAERVAGKAEMALVPRERIERIERAAKAQRLQKARAREIEVIRLRQAV